MLVIYDKEMPVTQDDAVRCAKAALHVFGKINSLLNGNKASGRQPVIDLKDCVAVAFRACFHFIGVIVESRPRVFHRFADLRTKQVLTKRVCLCSLPCIVRRCIFRPDLLP